MGTKANGLTVLVIMVICTLLVQVVAAQPTPFLISGWVKDSDGNSANNPIVNINNTNTSKQWQAEAHADHSYYQLIVSTTNISEGDVLESNATDGTRYNTTNHTVTQDNISNGGIFNFNITLEAPAPNVVINEFSSYNTSGDWIELYNKETSEVPLEGWSINDSVGEMHAFSAGDNISAGGYLAVDVGNRLNRNGDTITLLNNSEIIEGITYGSEADEAPAPGEGNSTGRYPNGVDTDNDAVDFIEFDTTTPGAPNTIPSSAVVSIADVSAPPDGSITVPIMVNNVANLGSGTINVTYNSSVVHVTDITDGTGNALEVKSWNINNSTGLMRIFACDGENPHSGDVIFANVTYNAVDDEESSTTLNITVGNLTDWHNYTDILHTIRNGTFTIIVPIKPVPSNIGANTTEAGMPVLFHAYWTSDIGLANYTFAWNDTGEWKNVSYGEMTGTGNWSNVTNMLNRTLKTIGWRIYANDTSGNLNDTGIQILTINDTTPPVPSNIGANTSEAGMPVLFSAYWTDTVGLANYTFAWNDTGEWVNDSVVEITGTGNWSNVTKTLNRTLKTIGWRIYCSDISGNVNDTGEQILTINDTTKPVLSNASAHPSTILNDNGRPRPLGTNVSRLNVTVTDIGCGILNVTINLSAMGGSSAQPMEQIEGTNIWTTTTNASSGINGTDYLFINATDKAGNFNISVSIPLTVLLRGDIVRNGAIDSFDALYIAKYLVGKESMPSLLVGDIVPATGDGKITSGDALYMYKYLVEKELAP